MLGRIREILAQISNGSGAQVRDGARVVAPVTTPIHPQSPEIPENIDNEINGGDIVPDIVYTSSSPEFRRRPIFASGGIVEPAKDSEKDIGTVVKPAEAYESAEIVSETETETDTAVDVEDEAQSDTGTETSVIPRRQAVVRFAVTDDGDLVKANDESDSAENSAQESAEDLTTDETVTDGDEAADTESNDEDSENENDIDGDERDSFELLDLAWQVVLAEMESTIDVSTIVAVLEEESLTDHEVEEVRLAVSRLRAALAAVARASLDSVR